MTDNKLIDCARCCFASKELINEIDFSKVYRLLKFNIYLAMGDFIALFTFLSTT